VRPAARGASTEAGAVAREVGRSMVLLALVGSSVGGLVGAVGLATRALGR
jgi:hypothetical protein